MKDLVAFVDIPGLRATLEEMGCTIPSEFAIDVERHLRQLVLRYKTVKRKPWKDLSSINMTKRRFFAAPVIEWGNYFVSIDKDFLRGWKKRILTPKITVATETLAGEKPVWDMIKKDLKAVTKVIEETGAVISTDRINRNIPRSRFQRHGQYEYVRITLEKDPEVTYSPHNELRTKTGYLSSFYGKDYLLVFGKHVEALLPTPGRLLLKDDDFFLFSRR